MTEDSSELNDRAKEPKWCLFFLCKPLALPCCKLHAKSVVAKLPIIIVVNTVLGEKILKNIVSCPFIMSKDIISYTGNVAHQSCSM